MRWLSVSCAVLLIAAALGMGNAQGAPLPGGHAVVIVSGGAAVSPFTTPADACASGLAAVNTDTALRQNLLDAGHVVYTSPASTWPAS